MSNLINPQPLDDNFYRRLGIVGDSEDVTIKDVKKAYFKAVKAHPPQRDAENFKLIKEAYDTLSNSISKNEYDAEIEFGDTLIDLKNELDNFTEDEDIQAQIRIIKKILLINSKSGRYRNKLGLAYLEIEKTQDAIIQFQKACNIDNNNSSYHINAGDAYSKSEDFSTALDFYQRAKDLDEDDHIPPIRIANLWYFQMDMKEEAYEILEEAIQADGKIDFLDFYTIFTKVRLYAMTGKARELGTELERIVDIAKNEQEKKIASYLLTREATTIASYGNFETASKYSNAAATMTDDDYTLNVDTLITQHKKILSKRSKNHELLKRLVQLKGCIYFGSSDVSDDLKDCLEIIYKIMQSEPNNREIKESIIRIKRNYPKSYKLMDSVYSTFLDIEPLYYAGDCPGDNCEERYRIDMVNEYDTFTCNSCMTSYEWCSTDENFIKRSI